MRFFLFANYCSVLPVNHLELPQCLLHIQIVQVNEFECMFGAAVRGNEVKQGIPPVYFCHHRILNIFFFICKSKEMNLILGVVALLNFILET